MSLDPADVELIRDYLADNEGEATVEVVRLVPGGGREQRFPERPCSVFELRKDRLAWWSADDYGARLVRVLSIDEDGDELLGECMVGDDHCELRLGVIWTPELRKRLEAWEKRGDPDLAFVRRKVVERIGAELLRR